MKRLFLIVALVAASLTTIAATATANHPPTPVGPPAHLPGLLPTCTDPITVSPCVNRGTRPIFPGPGTSVPACTDTTIGKVPCQLVGVRATLGGPRRPQQGGPQIEP